MSTALINRSLTTIRTELEFLRDSEVITEGLYDKLVSALPDKFQKDSKAWDVDRLTNGTSTPAVDNTSALADSLAKTSIASPPAYAPPTNAKPASKPVSYCTAIYEYRAQESDDISLSAGDKIAVVEHLSEDWWKGYKKGSEKTGVFPSNYVRSISESEYNGGQSEKSQYQVVPQQQQQQPPRQEPSYGGYAQFPPPSTNYYPPQQYNPPPPQQYSPAPVQQQPQQVVVEQPQQSHHNGGDMAKKFGKKLGNAAIFGAGASIGSNIVNSIF
ncbi:uncharacterized protein SPAPADRAFT_61991 [Spathaspora passalidarum NRRL Y-27907]|uniref:SH3 domain-containing protein n=1 Tax=Spathaspora passalidarum (strain NRRL Y-27907 / 11-Y1) TaxID=619300 RepID=G3AQ77_SPAPN|nr:uncharacterized protein SPAPADRAFT_61991 [Spathaspora passalidarum NRRL Y-27907]EGW31424.1 hypothetical protein SPAPADRAFT_61991 [Spathaspora passalidarum NRRL Y-27907]